MNHIGIFQDLNYLSLEELEKREEDRLKAIIDQEKALREYVVSIVDRYKLQFMDYVAIGMRNFLESPFNK